jgi:GT2 family glycosyltransferase
MSTPLVSVVIVTWNRRADLLETIQSVYEQCYPHFEIVVADNGSEDGTVAAVRQAYPAVRVVENGSNLGVSGGRNTGIRAAQGEIIFLLDSDASMGRETLTTVVETFQERPEVGVIACQVLNSHTDSVDLYAGRFFAESARINRASEFFSYTFSDCGCAIRAAVFRRVGLFWEALFFGREGEDFALRTWNSGYKVLYCPQAIVYHRLSPSKRIGGGEREYRDLRNALSIYLVRYPWWLLVCILPLKVATSLLKGLRKRCLGDILRACIEIVRLSPKLLRERRPMQTAAAQHYVRLQREHGPLSWSVRSWLKYKTQV